MRRCYFLTSGWRSKREKGYIGKYPHACHVGLQRAPRPLRNTLFDHGDTFTATQRTMSISIVHWSIFRVSISSNPSHVFDRSSRKMYVRPEPVSSPAVLDFPWLQRAWEAVNTLVFSARTTLQRRLSGCKLRPSASKTQHAYYYQYPPVNGAYHGR